MKNPPSLDFLSWFEIEENWDYTYVEISEDGGATWDVLPSEGTTDENPVGNSFGPGYTGSRDWQTRRSFAARVCGPPGDDQVPLRY